MTTLVHLAVAYEDFPQRLLAVVDQYPGAKVVRNEAGNLAILTANGNYIGYIDVLTGEVVNP